MPRARIYRPAKNAMQSGKARTKNWVLEFEPDEGQTLDPLMGWAGSGDTRQQLRINFESAEAAEAYARDNAIEAQVIEPHTPKNILKNYADRFAFNRIR